MLSRVPRSAVRRSVTRAPSVVAPRRGLVQPSNADRASVVDLPATYQDEAHFTPRSGTSLHCYVTYDYYMASPPDMLGFKLEVPRREGSLTAKTRPIYLDMQVRFRVGPTGGRTS